MAIVKPKQKSLKNGVYDIVLGSFLVLVIIICLYPFWHVLMYSLSDSKAAMGGGLFLLPKEFSVRTYMALAKTKRIYTAFGNSVAKTVVGTIFNLVMTTLMAYPLSQEELRGKRYIHLMMYFTMLFSGGMIPGYILIRNLGLLDTFWVYVIPGCLSVYHVFILRSFFVTIPRSLTESARLDGANPIQILCKIIIPLSKASLATICVYCVKNEWNSYMDGVLYVNKSRLELLQVYLRRMMLQAGAINSLSEAQGSSNISGITSESVNMTIVCFATFPVIVAYLFLQKYFAKGMMAGAVKG